MDERQREFLFELLETPSPTGFEAAGQRVWVEYVEAFADEVRTDAYGNAIAVHEGTGGPEIAVTGHADEIGFVVRRIDDDGYLHLSRVGGTDKTVSRGQHVTVHASGGAVDGVVGQTAIHLRERDGGDEVADISEQYVDIGATDRAEASELVDVGDPLTVSSTVEDLHGSRLAGRAMDNRVGVWTAAETLRQAAEAEADATVYAVSTVQEEVGGNGAQMVGFDLEPDAAVVVDVTHATDTPGLPGKKQADVDLGGGPTVRRGQPDHPVLVDALRSVAGEAAVDVQLEAASNDTLTDANSLFVQRGGIPSVNVGIPTRYMHTPVEVVDSEDLTATVELTGGFVDRAGEFTPYRTQV